MPTYFLKEDRTIPQKYSPEFNAKALQLIEKRIRVEQCSDWVARGGISPHTLRNWCEQSCVVRGESPSVSTDESEEMRRLRQENLELRRATEILRTVSAFFAAEFDRPTAR